MRKWTICQFEWYRDNKYIITVSNRKVWGGFFNFRDMAATFSPNKVKQRICVRPV